MPEDIEFIEIRLSKDDAIVLFDWLMTVDLSSVPITHPAEKQALLDLLFPLKETVGASVSQQEIEDARERVLRYELVILPGELVEGCGRCGRYRPGFRPDRGP